MSVGGMKNFQDGCLSNGHLKPWRNFETKVDLFCAVYNSNGFWYDILLIILGLVKFLEGQDALVIYVG